jgi:hypothetical protein
MEGEMMPKGKSKKGAGKDLPILVDPRLAKGLGHVLRQHIMLAAVQGLVSPSELSKLLNEGLSQVSYHVKVLHDDCELIELVKTEPRRGAVEHYYRAGARTLLPARAWRGLKKGMRAVVGAGQASDLFNDLANALKAGKLQGPHDHVIRTPLALDGEGQRNVKAIAERATREVENEQRAAARRVAKANGDGGEVVGCTFAVLAFEAAWRPAGHDDLAPRVGGAAASANGSDGTGHDGGGRKKGRRKAGAAG